MLVPTPRVRLVLIQPTLAPVSTAQLGVTGFWQVPALVPVSVSQASPYSILLCQLGAQVSPTSHLPHLLEPQESPSSQLHCQLEAQESRDLPHLCHWPCSWPLDLLHRWHCWHCWPCWPCWPCSGIQELFFFLFFELLFLSLDSFLD